VKGTKSQKYLVWRERDRSKETSGLPLKGLIQGKQETSGLKLKGQKPVNIRSGVKGTNPGNIRSGVKGTKSRKYPVWHERDRNKKTSGLPLKGQNTGKQETSGLL